MELTTELLSKLGDIRKKLTAGESISEEEESLLYEYTMFTRERITDLLKSDWATDILKKAAGYAEEASHEGSAKQAALTHALVHLAAKVHVINCYPTLRCALEEDTRLTMMERMSMQFMELAEHVVTTQFAAFEVEVAEPASARAKEKMGDPDRN